MLATPLVPLLRTIALSFTSTSVVFMIVLSPLITVFPLLTVRSLSTVKVVRRLVNPISLHS